MNEQNGCIREYYNCDEGIDCPCSKYETNKFYSFNINDEILIKLTPIGKDLLKKEHDELFKMYTAENKKDLGIEFTIPKEDEDGYSEWQLWKLMSILGKYCYNGCNPPFETTIRIPKP